MPRIWTKCRALWLVAIAMATSAGIASAALITRCDGLSGQAYYVEGGLVPKARAGWRRDEISNGSFLLLSDEKGYDIIFTDATGRTVSSRDDGGQVLPASIVGGRVVLIVNYANVLMETWVFDLDESGRGAMTLHQARYGDVPVRKHSVMRGACKKYGS